MGGGNNNYGYYPEQQQQQQQNLNYNGYYPFTNHSNNSHQYGCKANFLLNYLNDPNKCPPEISLGCSISNCE